MGVGGEKGGIGVGEGTVFTFLEKSARKESNDPPTLGLFFSVSPFCFGFRVHIIPVVCMLDILCLFLFSSRSILQLGT